jgi:hypothetical protein
VNFGGQVGVRLLIDGEAVHTFGGAGAAVLGHPANALAWLANHRPGPPEAFKSRTIFYSESSSYGAFCMGVEGA